MELPKLNYKFYQNQQEVTIEIYVKGLTDEDVQSTLKQPDLLEISIKGETHNFDLNGTGKELKERVTPYKIELTFISTRIPIEFDVLLKCEVKNIDEKQEKYKELDEVGMKDKIDDPFESMRQIYKQVDEKERHAMMKSFYESGGTVLSTNHDEVFKGKVLGYYQQKELEEAEKSGKSYDPATDGYSRPDIK